MLSYKLAMDIFLLTKKFPKEEMYSLTNQIRNSSRSVAGNIVEGWAKRKYENVFKRHLVDSFGSCEETKLWLDFARDCKYMLTSEHEKFIQGYEELSKMIQSLTNKWQTR